MTSDRITCIARESCPWSISRIMGRIAGCSWDRKRRPARALSARPERHGSWCRPAHPHCTGWGPRRTIPSRGRARPTTSLKPQQVVLAQTPSYTALDAAAARGTKGSLHLWVNTGGQVPRSADALIGSVPVFGYAWVDLATGLGVVAVIHPLIGRDSRQNPKGWHTHPVQLSAGAAFDFCIAGLGTAQGGIGIHDDVLRLNIALEQAGLSAGVLDVAAAFVVQPDAGCAATGLGVDVLDAKSLT